MNSCRCLVGLDSLEESDVLVCLLRPEVTRVLGRRLRTCPKPLVKNADGAALGKEGIAEASSCSQSSSPSLEIVPCRSTDKRAFAVVSILGLAAVWRPISRVGELGSGEGIDTISDVDSPDPGRQIGRLRSRLFRGEGTLMALGDDSEGGALTRDPAGETGVTSAAASTVGEDGTVAAKDRGASSDNLIEADEGLDRDTGRACGGVGPFCAIGESSVDVLGSEAYSADVREGGKGGRLIVGASFVCSAYSEIDQLSCSPSPSVSSNSRSASASASA